MKNLPPGQKESEVFPRFGLPQYANRFPKEVEKIEIRIGGELEEFIISNELNTLKRVDQTSDFHCVTTWSKTGLNWSGYRFRDFYTEFVLPRLQNEMRYVILKSQDGYKTSLPLEDLLHENVLLADRLDGLPLNIEHGAPMRLVAPDHYGYKNPKYINCMEFYADEQVFKTGLYDFIDHPRARVVYEERAKKGPGFFFRYLYRIGVKGTIKDYEKALAEYRAAKNS